MVDANTVLQPTTTQIASFNGPTLDLQTGTPRNAIYARVLVTAVSGTTPTATFKVQHSVDNATWDDHSVVTPQTVTTTGEYYGVIETSRRYVRLVSTIGGTTPSYTYRGDVTLARP